ncbi:hypothetical protein NPIL_476111 [Nephila pilipes]|uniref:Uncharacterized protein n=1 Tax=Nephila pilipes TaxID=299642 RepID=A0A8X6TBM6_NEPPI|nr:hypothetical protein NPIL_476111 [Nephila pilipes]
MLEESRHNQLFGEIKFINREIDEYEKLSESKDKLFENHNDLLDPESSSTNTNDEGGYMEHETELDYSYEKKREAGEGGVMETIVGMFRLMELFGK